MQNHLEIEDWRPIRAAELFLELNVEGPIGRATGRGSENALSIGAVAIVKVVPVWGDQVVHGVNRQAIVDESAVATCKLQVAV